jgi:hypothetical protein
MAPTRRLAALAAIAALSLSACASNDAKGSDVVDAMLDVGMPEDQAECIGNGFEAEFSQDQLNDLGSADDPEDFPPGTQDTVDAIISECTGTPIDGEGSGDEATGEGADDADTTTTAPAEGEGD